MEKGCLYSASKDHEIRCWDLVRGECLKKFVGHEGSVLSLDLNKNVLASGGADQNVIIWNKEV